MMLLFFFKCLHKCSDLKKNRNGCGLLNSVEVIDMVYFFLMCRNTVEPLIKDPPRKGHCINYLAEKDTSVSPNFSFPTIKKLGY